MFEAEIKYFFPSTGWPYIKKVIDGLPILSISSEEHEDTYYDSIDGSFYKSGKELRLRKVKNRDSNETRMELTFKDVPFDDETKSKPEYTIEVGNIDRMENILVGIGFTRKVSFIKYCTRYCLIIDDRPIDMIIVLIDGESRMFMEIEIKCSSENEGKRALNLLYDLGSKLGFSEKDFCNEYYTDIVLKMV